MGDDDQGYASHAHTQELQMRDIEDAFDRVLAGKATEADKEFLAWQLGISDHWKRFHAQRRTTAVG